MANQTIRISLRAYDHILLDKSTEKIVKTAKSTGAIISGPIPLPSKRSIYTILRSPHVNKKSREQFQTKIHIFHSTDLQVLDPSNKFSTNHVRAGKHFQWLLPIVFVLPD